MVNGDIAVVDVESLDSRKIYSYVQSLLETSQCAKRCALFNRSFSYQQMKYRSLKYFFVMLYIYLNVTMMWPLISHRIFAISSYVNGAAH